MDRRRFLVLFSGSSAGLVLAGDALLSAHDRMALLGGECSFCLGGSGVRSLAGMLGRPARVCDLCTTFLRSVLDGTVGTKPLTVRYVETSAPVPGEDAGVAPLRAWLRSDFRNLTPESARALHDQLAAKAFAAENRSLLEKGGATALAASPAEISMRLRFGDIFSRANALPIAASQYAMVASAYHHGGFFLKSVAVYKQALRCTPHAASVRHELADLYAQLGLEQDAASERRAATELGRELAQCSFCALPREQAVTLRGLDDRVCEPCVREASTLFERHTA